MRGLPLSGPRIKTSAESMPTRAAPLSLMQITRNLVQNRMRQAGPNGPVRGRVRDAVAPLQLGDGRGL